MAGIPIIEGFQVSAAAPIDTRLVVADQTSRLALSWVYKGLLVYQVDTNTFYKYTGTPPSNLVGDWTATLAQGTTGTPGSVWYNGSGAPSGGTGIIGDYYLDTASGNVYNKTGVSTWVIVTNIKGPTGASGTASGDYATILVTAGATTQSMTTTPAKLINFTSNGAAVGSIPDYTNNYITVANPGDYILHFNSDIIFTGSHIYTFTVYVNGSATQVTGTLNSASNTTNRISITGPINISASNSTVEIYGSVNTGTFNITLVTTALSVIGINSKGATGVAGNALIHTEHDLGVAPNANFDAAKISAVQAGTWTTIAPWSASIFFDSRADKSTPAALAGDKTGHSISYNGSTWVDNGVWRGPTGATGSPGGTGSTGATGPAGLIPISVYGAFASNVPFQSQPFGWYQAYCSETGGITLGTGCPVGTIISVLRYNTTPYDVTIQPDSYYAGHPLVVRNTSALMYGGANLTSLPLNVREVTLMYKGDGASQWDVIGSVEITPAAPVTSVNGLTGAVTIAPGIDYDPFSMSGYDGSSTDLRIVGMPTVSSYSYGSWTFVATSKSIPFISYDYVVFIAGGGDKDVTVYIEASYDNSSWSNLKTQTIRAQQGKVYQGHLNVVDLTYASPGVTVYYRLTIASGSTFTPGINAGRTSFGIIAGGS